MVSNTEMMKYMMAKIDKIDDKTDKIHDQTLLTNGRVTVLEKHSVGMWISNNSIKFTIICIALLSLLISDIRHPIINLLATFI